MTRPPLLTRGRLLAALVAAAVIVAGLVVLPDGDAQPPTPRTLPTQTTLPALTTTSTTTGVVVSTGRGPSAFTSTSAAGPLQLLVGVPTCAGYAGDGYQVRYQLTNNGAAVTGTLVAAVDDAEPTIIAPSVPLERGARLVSTATVTGSGESITLTLLGPAGPLVSSFPVEVPDCPVNPADERAAREATTTTGGGP